MKTIKIIDLFNMIAEGKSLPKEIKYDNFIWKLSKDKKDYRNECEHDLISEYIGNLIIESLNDTVEIIEESEQDIDIQSINELIIHKNVDNYNKTSIDSNREAINKLIRVAKQLDNKIKEK